MALTAGVSAQMLVINEVYPGGGSNTVATTSYSRDFVELYNKGLTAISLSGYALQYSPAGATSDFTLANTILSFGAGSVIGAGDYLSISTGGSGSQGVVLTMGMGAGNVTYVNPLAGSTGASLSASNGAVRLIDNNANVIDLVGYGTVATGPSGAAKSEGTAATAPAAANNTSLDRTNFVDTNSNSADFTALTPSPNGGTASIVVAAAPEPSTWAFMIGGIGTLVLFIRRRRVA